MVQQNDTSKKVSANSFWSILVNTKILAVIAEMQEELWKLIKCILICFFNGSSTAAVRGFQCCL